MKPTLNPAPCYVLITEDVDARAQNRKILCLLSSDILHFIEKIRRNSRTMLVYFRYFDCTLDAMGHQMLLQGYENLSVNYTISRMNPTWEDLRELLSEDVENDHKECDNSL